MPVQNAQAEAFAYTLTAQASLVTTKEEDDRNCVAHRGGAAFIRPNVDTSLVVQYNGDLMASEWVRWFKKSD